MAFFGLAQLPAASNDFYGICDYASSMAFELVTNVTDPAPEDVSVRFYFANGTSADNELTPFALFGQDEVMLSWKEFADGMAEFAIEDTDHWCEVCGNTDGACGSSESGGSDDGGASTESDKSGSGGISKAVAGVIGALVALVVVLGLEAAVMLIGGLRLVKKSTLAQASQTAAGVKSG